MKEPRILGFSPWTAAALKLPKTQIFEEAIDERKIIAEKGSSEDWVTLVMVTVSHHA
jgi:hypothetical protein